MDKTGANDHLDLVIFRSNDAKGLWYIYFQHAKSQGFNCSYVHVLHRPRCKNFVHASVFAHKYTTFITSTVQRTMYIAKVSDNSMC